MSPAPGVSDDESGPPPASPPLPGVPPDLVEHIAETHGAPLPGVPAEVGDHVLGTHSPLLPGVSFGSGHEASAVPVAEAGEPVASSGPADTGRRAHADDRLDTDDRLADDDRSATVDGPAAEPGAAAGGSDTPDTSRDVPRHRRPDDDSNTHQ